MGWPTKCLGKVYNSNTGFLAFCEAYTKGALMTTILCRRYRVCKNAKLKHTPPNKHDCVQNWSTDQSSKSMKHASILDQAINAPTSRGFVMDWIILDDNSVMRAHIKHKKSDAKTDKGKRMF